MSSDKNNFKEIFMIYFVGTTESQGKIAKKYQNNLKSRVKIFENCKSLWR